MIDGFRKGLTHPTSWKILHAPKKLLQQNPPDNGHAFTRPARPRWATFVTYRIAEKQRAFSPKAVIGCCALPLNYLPPSLAYFRRHFFTLDLLGGEPEWQLLQGWPFPIAAVACAFDVANESIANVSKTTAAVPTNLLTIANLIVFGYCIAVLRFSEHFAYGMSQPNRS